MKRLLIKLNTLRVTLETEDPSERQVLNKELEPDELKKEKWMADWREEYQRKLISAEEAAELVKSGDYVVFTMGREAYAVGLAIAARKEELRDVKIS